jgi:hypothetical protein
MSDGAVAEAVKTPVIVGRSLYEGTLTLKDALTAAERAAALPAPSVLGELDAARFEFAGTSTISSPSHPCPPAGSFPAPRARSCPPH